MKKKVDTPSSKKPLPTLTTIPWIPPNPSLQSDKLGTIAANTKPTLGTKVQAVRKRRSNFSSNTLLAKGLVW